MELPGDTDTCLLHITRPTTASVPESVACCSKHSPSHSVNQNCSNHSSSSTCQPSATYRLTVTYIHGDLQGSYRSTSGPPSPSIVAACVYATSCPQLWSHSQYQPSQCPPNRVTHTTTQQHIHDAVTATVAEPLERVEGEGW